MKWYVGVILLLLAALVLQSGLLAYAMYVLLGVLLISRFAARSWIGSLQRDAHLPPPNRRDRRACRGAGHGPQRRLAAGAVGAGRGPAAEAGPGAEAAAAAGCGASGCSLRSCWAGKEIVLNYKIEPPMRGYYQIGPLVLETGDLFGLHRRYRVERTTSFCSSTRRVVPLPGYDIASRRPIGEVRLTHRLYEDPTRIAGVRQYQAGDPLNRVHWRATARTGQLHSKIYEPSTLAGATVAARLPRGRLPAARRAVPLRAGRHDGRLAGQRGLPDGPAGRPGDERPRRRRARYRPKRDRATIARGRPPGRRCRRGRRTTACSRWSWRRAAASSSSSRSARRWPAWN